MPFIDRDESGKIKGIYACKQREGQEYVEDDSEEVALFNRPTYRKLRAKEYPPMSEYVDGIVKGDQAQVDKYIADCLAVKQKYPKG